MKFNFKLLSGSGTEENMKKRVLSILLCLMMVPGLAPVSIFAETAVSAHKHCICGNTSCTKTSGSGSDDYNTIDVAEGKSLTVTDCQKTVGKITHAEGRGGSGIENRGTFTLWKGSITGNGLTKKTMVIPPASTITAVALTKRSVILSAKSERIRNTQKGKKRIAARLAAFAAAELLTY